MSIIINTTPARKAPQFMSHAGWGGSGIEYTWEHNIEPQAKAVVIPWTGSWYWGLYAVSAHVGGVAATSVASTTYNFSGLNYGTFILYVLLNPPTGLQTCRVAISSANGACSGASFTYDKVTSYGTGAVTGSQSFSVSGGNNVTVVNSFMKLGDGWSGGNYTGFSPNPTWVTANNNVGDGFPGAANPTFGFTSTSAVSPCWGLYVPLIGEP